MRYRPSVFPGSSRGESLCAKTGVAPNDAASGRYEPPEAARRRPAATRHPGRFLRDSPAHRHVARQRSMKDLRHLSPPIRCHRGRSPFKASYSHARAAFQSRSAVATEISSTCAISSNDRPPKKFSSAIRLLLGSNSASLSAPDPASGHRRAVNKHRSLARPA